jgi:broad specificity phosphatase PhoE
MTSIHPPHGVPTTIVTIRHGTTTFAHRHVIAGRLDVPLSEQGIAASVRLRGRLDAIAPDVVVSSPLRRALDTAMLATGLAEEAIDVRPSCMERDYGRMQGLEPEEIAALEPPVRYIAVGGYEHSLDPPGGETFPELRARATRFRDELLHDHAGMVIAVFTHQTFLQQFQGLLLGLDVHACLALDIGHLEMGIFTLGDGALIDHRIDHWLDDPDASW